MAASWSADELLTPIVDIVVIVLHFDKPPIGGVLEFASEELTSLSLLPPGGNTNIDR